MLVSIPGNEAAFRTPKFNPGRSHIPRFTSRRSKPICDDITAILADWIPEQVGEALVFMLPGSTAAPSPTGENTRLAAGITR